MKYHDYHLSGYSVSDFGKRIVLHLVSDIDGPARNESHIEFSDVSCYHFNHTTGAIITDIEEVEVGAFVENHEALLSEFAKKYGLEFWTSGSQDYVASLKRERLRSWLLESAIGFSGFVIAREIRARDEPSCKNVLSETAPKFVGR